MHNSIDINHYGGYIIRIGCNKLEDGLKTTPNFQCALNIMQNMNKTKEILPKKHLFIIISVR